MPLCGAALPTFLECQPWDSDRSTDHTGVWWPYRSGLERDPGRQVIRGERMAVVRWMDLEVAAPEDVASLVEDRAHVSGRIHGSYAEVVLVGLARLAMVLGHHVEPVAFLPAGARLVPASGSAVVRLIDVEVVVGTARLPRAWLVDMPAHDVADATVELVAGPVV